MNSCPSPEQLAQLLAGTLPEDLRQAVRAHLRHCPACQAELDRRTDNAELRAWTAGLPTAASLAHTEPALARVLEEIRSATDGQGAPAPAGDGSPSPPAPRPGGELGMLGPYRLEAELGRGGMGIVYRAYDEALNRLVAIKVLRPERADPAAQSRLLREAQIAAQFRHDHVVTVYAVSLTTDGLPYLVMEYLPGPTLAALIHTQHHLEPREAAAIAAQAADGLAAAHAAGLIHRDVKPSNIILDGLGGRPKLLDFGLARWHAGASLLTQEGTLAGTPTYMSPEQVQGLRNIDGRADVYGLGITLYEALTGEAPFRGTPAAVLRQVLEEEPRPPRQLNDAVPRELETICLKAVAREPGRRYQTAGEMADDLRRWLRGEPIKARPVGTLQRGWRWCRRNPRVAVLIGVVLTLLLCLALGSLGAAWRINQEKTAALQAAADAVQARQEAAAHAQDAVEHFRLALDTVNALIEQVRRLEGTPGTLAVKQQIATTALQKLEQIAQSAEKTHAVDESLVHAHDQLAGLFLTLGKTDEARQQWERMRQRAEDWTNAEPDSLLAKSNLALSHDKLGDQNLSATDFPAATTHYRAALELRQALVERDPGNRLTRRAISVSWNKLGNVSLRAGDAPSALDSFREGLKWREALPPTESERTQFLSDMRFTYSRLGEASTAMADDEGARGYYLKALDYATELVQAGVASGRREEAMCHELLGALNQRMGDLPAAADHLQRCLETRKELADADSGNVEARRDVYRTLSSVAINRALRGDLEGARAALLESMTLCETLAANDPGSLQKQRDLGIAYARLADLEDRTEHFVEAAAWMGKGAELYRRLEAGGKAEPLGPKAAREYYEGGQALYTAAAKIGLDDLPAIRAQEDELQKKLLAMRALALGRRGHYREAVEAVEQLRQRVAENTSWGHTLARGYALAAAALGKLPGPLTPELEMLRQRYADTALDILRVYLRANPQELYLVPDEPDFAAVRGRPEFKDILRETSQAAKKPGR
jgi:eukaryotic-like serine/threonine-protein kinase